jgi:ankyrin repeat protein
MMLINTILEGSKEDECLTALFLTDPRDDREKLIQRKGSRVDGTCEWIKTNALYNSWLRSHSQLLWLSGGPGKGKTMLSIFLAEELERTARLSQNTLFLQYFCDNKDPKRNTAVTIIRGLIFQLLQLRPNLFDFILPSFKIQKESLFTGSSFETLWRIFETMLRDPVLGTVYCVLDGLDECDEASLVVLLKKFRALFSTEFSESSTCHLNLIIVSRDHPDFIPEILSSFSRIRLDPDADREVNNDIHRFIEVKVNELSVSRQYPEQLRIRVKEVFYNRAEGTFLWVGIAAEALRKYRNSEVPEALDNFPSGLDELYARILLQINVDRRETAAKILRWTVMAIRPLTLSELSVALNVKPSVGFSRDEVIRDQASYCGYFLTIKEDEVGLIHQSAKDYLLRKSRDPNPELEIFRVKEDMGNLEVARKCFHYLQNGALAGGKVNLERSYGLKDTSRLKDFPLLSYATMHWPEHARSLARSEDIFGLSLPFYAKKSPVRESWLKTYWAAEMYRSPPDSFTLLHLASFFGILPLAENLVLKKGWINTVKRLLYINQRDSNGRTALSWAAERGHEAVVRLLLEKGADVEAKTTFGETALPIAARGGHEAVVRLLLEKGADVEANNGWTALHWAAGVGHEAVVRLLLEKGADVEAKTDNGGTALHEAARGGHEAIVRLLLEKGADVEAKTTYGGTALHEAARGGHEAVVRLLTPLNS